MYKPLLAMALFAFTAIAETTVIDRHSANDTTGSTAVVTINGLKLTLTDLQPGRADPLFQAKNTYYETERKALSGLIDQYLVKQEANKESLSVDQLIERHVKASLAEDPTDEALRVYYEGLDTNEPYEAVRGKILEHIREHRLEKARQNYVQSLRNRAEVVINLPPPRADIDLKDAPVLGSSNPVVTVVEFADYECPYCQQVYPELKQLTTEYQGKVAFAYKDTPLPMHTHAQKAAEAAHCAGAQGKFWEYHDMLFTTKQLDPADLKQNARKLGLDASSFDKCLDGGEQAKIVAAQLAESQSLGVSGTPSFFINGRFVSGAATYATLREIVEQELAANQPQTTARR